jgi:WS/DGAT/MGAT family acyltransferase
MTASHLDRLTAVDASFLAQEGASSHMHVGAVMIFEGPAPSYPDLLDQIRGRLHLVPRYRQKLAVPPMETGRPLWVDDPTFNLEYHVRHTALPSPGSEEQLLLLAARIHSQRLDRSKPLWETWLVEGLEGNRFGLLSKTHHALVDGVAGVDLATVLFDLSPDPEPADEGLEPWQPRPEPSAAELVAAGVKGAVKTTAGLAARTITAATRPSTTLNVAREAAEGVGEIVWAGLNPAPDTPLNVPIGPHRRYAIVRGELEDYKHVKDALGGTVNDVVLTVVSGALAKWLHSRGVRTEGLEMRALVPVSIRSEEERGELGNRIAVMRGPLPVYIKDPVARLKFVKQAMDGLKESKQAVGAEVLTSVQQLAPPTVLAQASRLNFSTRLFNLIVTNVPGPQFPLYMLGRRLIDLFPIAFLPDNHGLAIAIMSYDGGVNFGLLGDYDALPDIDAIAAGLEESLLELRRAAAKKSSGKKAATAPTGRKTGTARASGPAAEMRAKRRGKARAGSGRNGASASTRAKRSPSRRS